MSQTAAVLLTAALLVAVVPAAAAISPIPSPAVAAQTGTAAAPWGNETAPAPPGARLSGLVAVQGSEVENEIERRAFGVRIARANSDASRAAVVAEQVDDLRRRTAEIEAGRRALLQARRNGSITQARFEAEMAALAVRNGAVNARLNETEAVAADLPEDVLAERGIDATTIDEVRNEARQAGGPAIADIARAIAGGPVGGGLSAGANVTDRGPEDRPGRPSAPTDRRPDADEPETDDSIVPTTDPITVTTPARPTVDRAPAGPYAWVGADDGRGPADGSPLGWLP